MLTTLIVVAGIYVASVAAILIVRHIAQIRLRQALNEGNDGVAISLAWAWASVTDILALQKYWGNDRFKNILDFPRPRQEVLLLPHKSVVVLLVIMYQLFGRHGKMLGSDDCPSVPNCSNYFIGCLARYNLISAMARAQVRVTTCFGNDEPNFQPDFT